MCRGKNFFEKIKKVHTEKIFYVIICSKLKKKQKEDDSLISKDDVLAAIDGAGAYAKEKNCTVDEVVAIIRGAVMAMKDESCECRSKRQPDFDGFVDDLFGSLNPDFFPDMRERMKPYTERRCGEEMDEIRDRLFEGLVDSLKRRRESGDNRSAEALFEGILEGFRRGMRLQACRRDPVAY